MTWDVHSYSATPASNSNVNGVNIAEGCNASGINDAIRQLMADLATQFNTAATFTGDVAVGDDLTVTGDLTVGATTVGMTRSGAGPALTEIGTTTLASGLILKWGYTVAPGGSPGAVITFSTPFPNNIIGGIANVAMSGQTGHYANTYPMSASQMGLTATVTGSFQVFWLALGY